MISESYHSKILVLIKLLLCCLFRYVLCLILLYGTIGTCQIQRSVFTARLQKLLKALFHLLSAHLNPVGSRLGGTLKHSRHVSYCHRCFNQMQCSFRLFILFEQTTAFRWPYWWNSARLRSVIGEAIKPVPFLLSVNLTTESPETAWRWV